jgi:hypothetical protein
MLRNEEKCLSIFFTLCKKPLNRAGQAECRNRLLGLAFFVKYRAFYFMIYSIYSMMRGLRHILSHLLDGIAVTS